MTIERPTWIEVDLGAVRHNVGVVRKIVGQRVKIFAVCKGDGYGVGAVPLAKAAIEAGADAAACSDPAEAIAMREAGIAAPILLYASTAPEDLAAIVERDIIVTVHDIASIEALAALGRSSIAYLKLDCGFGRLGFPPAAWDQAFRRLALCQNIRVAGLYCHLGFPEDRARMYPQVALFHAAAEAATQVGLKDFDRMVASSRVVIDHPDLAMTAVNPGRMICGILESPWDAAVPIKPVLAGLKSRIIHIKTLPAGATIAYGEGVLQQSTKIAIAPIGFADGYPRLPPGGNVLVHGRRMPLVGSRATEHTTFDVTALPEAVLGDEVVFMGRQGSETITGNELAGATGVPLIELMPRLGRSARRVYRH